MSVFFTVHRIGEKDTLGFLILFLTRYILPQMFVDQLALKKTSSPPYRTFKFSFLLSRILYTLQWNYNRRLQLRKRRRKHFVQNTIQSSKMRVRRNILKKNPSLISPPMIQNQVPTRSPTNALEVLLKLQYLSLNLLYLHLFVPAHRLQKIVA